VNLSDISWRWAFKSLSFHFLFLRKLEKNKHIHVYSMDQKHLVDISFCVHCVLLTTGVRRGFAFLSQTDGLAWLPGPPLCCHTGEWNYQHHLSQSLEVWDFATSELSHKKIHCVKEKKITVTMFLFPTKSNVKKFWQFGSKVNATQHETPHR